MKETWRWFGPDDPVTLDHARQAGATGIVTALHHVPAGEPWPLDEVRRRRAEVEAAGLTWSVVESIWMPDTLKSRTGAWRAHLEAWKTSLRACGRAGVRVVCYNFMPVVDWTRTDLRWPLPTGGSALRFDLPDFVAYDAFVLKRPGAEADYPAPVVAEARTRAARMSEGDKAALERNVIAGLPGGSGNHDRAGLRATLAAYQDIAAEDLRANLVAFLRAVVPVAEEMGVRLCIHPDDPPFPLFGLPRVVSTADDAGAVLAAVDSPANGLTFCTGSYGARGDNEPLADMVGAFGPRIHFAHLRNVRRETDEATGSFHEAEHLDGSTDLVAVVGALLAEEARRRAEGRADAEIPMRPDHGHLLLDDQTKARINPGYSAIGRLKGLAELRGVMRALQAAPSPEPRAER